MKVSADYRMLALDALRGKWKTAVLTGIAASALGATIVSSSNSAVSNSNQAKDIHFELFSQPNGGRLLAVLLAGIVLWAIPAGSVHRPLVAAVGDSGNRENIQLCDDTLHHVRASFADRK